MSFSISQPNDRQWGELQPDGTWTGIIGALLAGEARIGVVLIDLNYDRTGVVDALRLPSQDSVDTRK